MMNGGHYLGLLGAFADDSSPEVIGAVIDGLDKAHTAFITPELAWPFAAHVRSTLRPALQRFGATRMAGEPDPVTMLRPRLVSALGEFAHDPEVLEQARAWTRDFLEDPSRVDPTFGDVMLALAAHQGDSTLLEAYRTRFENAKIPAERRRMLTALAGFRDPVMVDRVLAYCLEGPLRPQEVQSIPYLMTMAPALQERVWSWMVAHYDSILKRIPPSYAANLAHFANGCSEQRLEMAKTFFSEANHSPAGTREEFAKVADSVRDCVGLREREGRAIERYLRMSASSGATSASR